MLLRRITQHVRNQNWFAVFIDFLIVVVGVFIGIQVANWNEERVERGAEAGYLILLEQDVDISLREVESFMTMLNSLEEARQTLYEFSLSDQESLAASEWPALIQKSLWAFDSLELANTTFESLRSSGRMGVLGDKALVAALQDLSVLQKEAETETSIELSLVESFGDPLLFQNIDMAAIFQLPSMTEKRIQIPWLTATTEPMNDVALLKTQPFRNALLFRSVMTHERLGTLQKVKDKYLKIKVLIDKRKQVLGVS